jgi:hypothetical protein
MPVKTAGWFYQLALIICLAVSSLPAGEVEAVSRKDVQGNDERERELAARFAPVFYQGLGERPRNDYFAKFDFDGDWRADNNWAHADERRFPLKAYVYYAVSETATHFFIHYAVYHPRDYKGGDGASLYSQILREGTRRGSKYDPTGQLIEIALAHENDLEGCLVAVAKSGDELEQARVVFVETVAHSKFLKYVAEGSTLNGFGTARMEGQRPRLYVEPKGHGIQAYRGTEKPSSRKGVLTYSFNGQADDPEQKQQKSLGYDLIPISTTLWPRAQHGVNETYGEARDYGQVSVSTTGEDGSQREIQVKLGKLGSAFLGRVGAHNMARPPWGWFDRDEVGHPPGTWFFDPARTIKRHFKLGNEFATSYTYAPFLGIERRKVRAAD